MELLSRYNWPGNIRELQNVVERAVVLSPGPVLKLLPDLLPSARPSSSAEEVVPRGNGHNQHASLEEVEKHHIIEVLKQTSWVIEGPRGAAKILGRHPNTLRSRMKKLGIERSTAV